MLHFLQFFIVLLRNILYFPRIVELDQVYGFLYILELFFVTRPQLLILSPEILDPLYFLTAVLLLLNQRPVTHCWILFTSTFFWMVYLVKCLCFFNASFSFCNCKRSNQTRFRILSTLVYIFFNSFFSLRTEIQGFILRLSPIRIINLLISCPKLYRHTNKHLISNKNITFYSFYLGLARVLSQRRSVSLTE